MGGEPTNQGLTGHLWCGGAGRGSSVESHIWDNPLCRWLPVARCELSIGVTESLEGLNGGLVCRNL